MPQSELSVRVLDGVGYQRVGNTITPDAGQSSARLDRAASWRATASSTVPIFDRARSRSLADTVPPQIVLIGSGNGSPSTRATTYIGWRAPRPPTMSTATSATEIVVDNPVDTDQRRYLHRHLQLSKTSRATTPPQQEP